MCKYFFCKSPWPLPWKHRSTSTIWIWLSVSGKAMVVGDDIRSVTEVQKSNIQGPPCPKWCPNAPTKSWSHPTEYSSWAECPTALPHTCSCSNMEWSPTFKMHYTHHNAWSILYAGEETFVTISECWKSYSTADYTVNIKESMNVLRFTALNDCWKKLWSEAVTKLGIPHPAG
jgi:hypothetical protein